jgi:hypothetical protein
MKRHILLSLITLCFSIIGNLSNCFGQENSFDKELKRLKTKTAQVFGNNISQMPAWSEQSDILYCMNQSDDIFSINLNEAKLTVGVWHGDTIGVISLKLIKQLTPTEKENYISTHEIDYNKSYPDSIKTKLETIVKFAHGGLILQEKGKKGKILWISSSVCGGIVLSPDEKYVVFYCETSGVFIMKIQ